MRDAQSAQSMAGEGLFEQIGRFLATHRLRPDPAHYAFAHAVLSAPDGALAAKVAQLTEGGVRLLRRDIEALGGEVVDAPQPTDEPVERRDTRREDEQRDGQTDRLVAETQRQVDGFATIMQTFHAETRGFGDHLAESAAAITTMPNLAEIDAITRITTTMIERIRESELRLAKATQETNILRAKLIEARDTARRDTLTGLPNRRAFDEAFAARDPEGGPYCLAVCDVDRFKRVNDAFGHGVGDRVLTAIGQTIADGCDGHLVVRHGGEEFAVLLSGISLSDAAELLDTVRGTVAAKRFRNRETDNPLGQITFSAGVTAIHADETAESAFARADRLLYTAKDDGRDRVCTA